MPEKKRKHLKIILFIIVGIIVGVLIVKLLPWFYSFSDQTVRTEFKEYVDSLGIGGIFFILGLQIFQIIVAILPGESIELLAGMVYGTWGGLLICMIGIIIGSSIIFFAVRNLGKGFVEKIFSSEKVKRLAFLQNEKKLELIIFILFFIPGTPKDILTYMAPLTKIKPSHFLVISFFARIPSVISSTYAGETIIDGEWWKTGIVFVVMGMIGLGGILVNHYIVEKRNVKDRD